ncbi:MAG: biopolymer transporter ExbD [Planctomycetes bacterium]|nr:biopolymer transporter ExbD [Planctomycetota bacterium]
MRRATIHSGSRRETGNDVAMTPMIDVVFQLIIFFLWTSSFRIVEHTLPSSVSVSRGSAPGAMSEAPPPEEDFDEVVIRIRGTRDALTWEVNETPVESLAALRAFLGQLASVGRVAPVIVHPDPDVPLGAAIDAYDAARLHQFRVAFATPLEDGEP